MKNKMCGLCKIACLLLIIGAINWGLVGIFNFNLVGTLLGETSIVSRVIYGLVGVAGLMVLLKCFKGCPTCNKTCST